MIESLDLVNWRSHQNTHLDFRGGTNLIVGIMGSGKSSVLDGISFALFGTFPSLERRKSKLEDLVRLNEVSSKITLTLKYQNVTYKIERLIERNKRGTSTSAELFKNNSLLEHGTSAVTTYLSQLLSLDYDLFTRAIYCEQNSMDHFLGLDPRKRKAELDSLLGLDRFETARANLVTIISRIKSKKDDLSSRFDPRQRDLLSYSKAEKVTAISSLRERQVKLSSDLLDLKNKHLSLTSNYATLKDKKIKFEDTSRQISLLTGRISGLESESLDFNQEKILELKENRTSLEKSLAEQNLLIKKHTDAIISTSREISRLESMQKNRLDLIVKIEKLKSDLSSFLAGSSASDLLSKLDLSEKDVLSKSALISSIDREILELKEMLPKMKDGLLQCPICSNSLSSDSMIHLKEEKEKLILQKQSTLINSRQDLIVQKSDLEKLRQSYNRSVSTSELISNYEKQLQAVADQTSVIEECKSKLSALEVEKENVSRSISVLNPQINSINVEISKLLLLEKKSNDLKQSKEQLSKLNEQIKLLDFDIVKFDSLRSDLEQLSLSIERNSSDLRSIETDLSRQAEMLSLIERDLLSTMSLESEIKELSMLEEELMFFRNALLSTQLNLRNDLIGAINSAMNEIWSIFYPYRNYSSVRVLATEKDYSFEVESFGSWKALESLASGGERASFALVLRVALSIVLSPKIGLLLLDEPTHNLDRSAVELLSNTLQFKVPEVVEQAFVITHEEGLMGSEFGSSYKFIRDKSIEGETKVERI